MKDLNKLQFQLDFVRDFEIRLIIRICMLLELLAATYCYYYLTII